MNDALRRLAAWRSDRDRREVFEDSVVAETAIALVYNGSAHAVMMATPADLEDFALGFSLSEGIVADAAEWRFIDAVPSADGITIEMLIPQPRFDALRTRQRRLAGSSACGLCGSESLQAALRPPAPVADADFVGSAAMLDAMHRLAAAQPLNAASGGVHAAGLAYADGLLVREDVGRHNALDKLIGARARAGIARGFVVMTSRASYELVHKTASAGIGLLATMSAPTSAAIALADAAGITLAAFVRGERMNVYTHSQRVWRTT